MARLKEYVVLYREPEAPPADPPFAFECLAEDNDHAEEQCLNAYPDATVSWVYEGGDSEDAYEDYYAW